MELVIIGSGNGLSPVLSHATIWTHVDILSIEQTVALQWIAKPLLSRKCTRDVVCKMATILSRLQCASTLRPSGTICLQKFLVNIGSGNVSLPGGTKPLPRINIDSLSVSPVAFFWGTFYERCCSIQSLKLTWKLLQIKHFNQIS